MTQALPPSDEEIRRLIDGTIGAAERERIEALLEANPDRMRAFEEVTGFATFRSEFLAEAPTRRPVLNEQLVGLIGKLRSGDFHRPTPDEEAMAALDKAPAGGEPGRLGKFEIIELMATGGMGMVFRARDPDLDRLVAIKALTPRLAQDPEARECFLAEAKLAAALDHPNVLPIYDVAEGKHVPYFVMRLVNGESLAEMVARDGALPPRRAAAVAMQAARALAEAHAKGVIHRDVKPANLLLEDGGRRVWVADFGIAHTGEPAATAAAGTPGFAAPEQMRGAEPTATSDLFGLGATLHFALAGKAPSEGTDPPKAPKALRRLMVQLLRIDPATRPQSAEQVAKQLRRLRRSPIPRRVAISAGVSLLLLIGLAALTPLGLTGWANRALGTLRGEFFHIEGKFGTFPSLATALEGAIAGDVLLVDFDGERQLSPTVVNKPHTIRAAPGRWPVFVQAVPNPEALKLKAPSELVGLTFVRPPVSTRPSPVLAAMFSKLTLRNCNVVALERDHLAVNAVLFSYGLPNIEIHDCCILTGQIRWYNMSAKMSPNNQRKGSLRVSNSFISAARGPNLVCKNIDVAVDLQNVTCLGLDLFLLRPNPNHQISIAARDSVLLTRRSVVYLPWATPQSVGGQLDWAGSGNIYSAKQPGFVLYRDDSLKDAAELPFVTQESPGQSNLDAPWIAVASIEEVRDRCAAWLETARPGLEKLENKGADLGLMEKFVENR